ncbi:hypothetical protein D1871_04380 [Nakamurella silvestris]|nr:hypothetical protein D1871_04380 [Nakamurella silvestris]
MTRAFRSRSKPVEYWTIDIADEYCAIHTGDVGTHGEWQLQEYLDADIAAESFAELIAGRKQAGFAEDKGFDPNAQVYLDDPEFGLHELTSHPAFKAHFTDPLYLDVAEEESPFGSDNGADALASLTEGFEGKSSPDLLGFAENLVTSNWEMQYHPPGEDTDIDYWAIGGPSTSDQAIIATAFGSIKITGRVPAALKELAVASLERWRELGAFEEVPSPALTRMIEDLRAFPV